MKWSSGQYLIFEDERSRPVRDLLNAVPATKVRAAIDLGCGPGNSTELLLGRFPKAMVMGLDSSAEMIAAARRRLPGVEFHVATIEAWDRPASFDIILANAVLQWVPEHAVLLPRLIRNLAPGGSFAIQMPDNLDEPAHRLMREVAKQGSWADKLSCVAATRRGIGNPRWYFNLLRPFCTRVDVWQTIYQHPLAGGVDAVVEWFKGSSLRPFLAPLDDGEARAFLERYQQALKRVYSPLPDGTVLLPFPRLFIVATR